MLQLKINKLKEKRKSRDITLQTKICIVKAMVLPVVMYRVPIFIGRTDAEAETPILWHLL